jgi:hypothetical protein
MLEEQPQGGKTMGKNGRRTTKWCVLAGALLVVAVVLAATPVGAAGGARYVDKNVARDCAGLTQCYQSIQLAVNDAQPGDTIYVFPGTYKEGVDLNAMDPQGNITLITVDANGNPTPGTVTVDNDDAPEIYTGDPLVPFDGDVTIDGFVLRSPYGAIDLWVGEELFPSGAEAGLGPFLSRDVVIRSVDASHTGGDGIAVRAQGDVTIKDCTTNDNEGYGIGVMEAWGDVTITGCTSNNNKGPSVSAEGSIFCMAGGICVSGTDGQITIRNNTANGNGSEGILVGPLFLGGEETGLASVATPDKVIIDKCTANGNHWEGISVVAEGDVTITDCTTNGNDGDGVYVGRGLFGDEAGAAFTVDGGDVSIKNCTSNGNEEAGFDPENVFGTLSILDCIAMDNEDGVDLDNMSGAESISVNGSIICGNDECGVLLVPSNTAVSNAVGINLEGNWWGCAGGPEAAGCDPICQEDSIPVDFTPWISKISDSATVDPVTVGQPTVVSFQFSGNPSAVYLGQGPGDLRGPAPFRVSTDNGTLNGNGATVKEFINAADGTLKVTLVPAREGTATVTVSGPCGLADLEGATAVLGVLAVEFVPEPGSVMLLASGLMGLAGYAGLRLRKR